jgi:hypothetical protein
MIKIVQAQPFTWLYLKMDTKPPTAMMNFTDQLYP